MKIRLPWRFQKAAYSTYQHASSLISRMPATKRNETGISFLCNYQQATGATVAIASIANQFSDQYNVEAHIKPLSVYTRLLSLRVRQYFSVALLSGQIVFVDIEQENAVIERLLGQKKLVILTCHAFPTILHSVPQEKLIRNLELCTHIHFVSEYQRAEFIRRYPGIDIEPKSFVIPNYTRQSRKKTRTGNIGIVGLLNRAPKNALEAVHLAQLSNARWVECWGSDRIHGLNSPGLFSKLRIHGWSDNIQKIHGSFDVLLSTSRSETFGLVVIEALSAGIPCVLSDIPVYRELYSGCKGVAFLTGNEQQDIETINALLDQAKFLKQHIIGFWNERFSNAAIRSAWVEKITQLTT